MLEHHPRRLSGESGQGPLPERPLLAPWLRRLEHGGTLLLEYADEIVALDGAAVSQLPSLLDGTRPLESLEPGEREAVERLAREGVVVPGPATGGEEALREAALGGLAPGVAAARLEAGAVTVLGRSDTADEAFRLLAGRRTRAGWDEPVAGVDLAIAAPGPQELPCLGAWNERCLDTGTPWLLALPFNGRFAAVGPLFLPGETCCYRCLVRRRASALPDSDDFLALESAPAGYPVGASLAAILGGTLALVAARWLVRRDAALAGALLAFELDAGLRATRHRVLRVPRCEACSPAAGEPPLVPWASATRR